MVSTRFALALAGSSSTHFACVAGTEVKSTCDGPTPTPPLNGTLGVVGGMELDYRNRP